MQEPAGRAKGRMSPSACGSQYRSYGVAQPIDVRFRHPCDVDATSRCDYVNRVFGAQLIHLQRCEAGEGKHPSLFGNECKVMLGSLGLHFLDEDAAHAVDSIAHYGQFLQPLRLIDRKYNRHLN